ncbi:hypothetical protein [Streptomyces sp. NPDC094032]|uniref:hypothetical protein n=1 Tax=Streptomyces sp. NPDC094032 TaxID=3155308 RepID=UPI00331F0F27
MTSAPKSSPPIRAVPGLGFVAGCVISTWIDAATLATRTPVAYILIAHVPPRRPGETTESIEEGLMGMVDGMKLRPASERVPITGARLGIRGPFVALDYGNPGGTIRLPRTEEAWRAHALRGSPVCIAVGLDPIPPGASQDTVGDYLARVSAADRLYLGATTVRAR